MTFLNPFLLFGLALGAAPIIIHLLNRRRYRIVQWAAMEFLLEATRRNFRRLRIEHILLLIIRTLILLLLVFALSRPFLKEESLAGLAGSPRRHVLIAVDHSFSMGYQVGTRTPFERAKRSAESIIRTLDTGDTISLVALSDRVKGIIVEPSFDFDVAVNELARMELSHRGTNITEAIAALPELLAKVANPKKEVYLITDMQRGGWDNASVSEKAPSNAAAKLLSDTADIHIVDVGFESPENVALVDLFASEKIVGSHVPTRLVASVVGYQQKERANVLVEFFVDGLKQGSANALIMGSQPTLVSSNYLFRDSGSHVVTAKIAADRLPVDNERFLSLKVREEIKVLCVNGEPSVEPFMSETDYLRAALLPGDLSEIEKSSLLLPEIVTEIALRTVDFGKYDAVILANLRALPQERVEDLESFVHAGGALVVFMGDQVDTEFYNDLLYNEGKGLLPAQLLNSTGDETDLENYLTISPDDYRHPMLRLFADKKIANLESSRVYRYISTRPDSESLDVNVVCNYANGEPALIEKRFGEGRVMLVTTTCDSEWTDMPRKPVFLPLVHEMLGYVVRSPQRGRNLVAGETIEMELIPSLYSENIVVETPQGEKIPPAVATRGEKIILSFDDVENAGIYAINVGQGGVSALEREVFAVNVPADESDLSRIDEAEIRELYPELRFNYTTGEVQQQATEEVRGRGREIWKPLLMLVLALMCVEPILAFRIPR